MEHSAKLTGYEFYKKIGSP